MAKHWPLFLVLITYSILVFPRLANFPPVRTDDAYQMAPAHSLLTRGVWGSAPMRGAATKWRDSHPDEKTYFQPPLYLLLVAVSLKLLGFGVLQARLASALLGVGTVAVTYFLALEMTQRRIAATIAALLLLSQPVFVQISRQARPESAVTFFTVLAVYLFVKYHRAPGSGWPLLTGLAIGAALMSHYNGAFGLIALFVLFLIGEKPIEKHLDNSRKPDFRRLALVTKLHVVSIFKSRRIRLYLLGIVLISLPYAIYVLMDHEGGFHNFRTQISVIGRAGTLGTLWEYVRAEPTRYTRFFHDYRFATGSGFLLGFFYICVIAFALIRRKSGYRTLLIVLGIHLLLLLYPSPNKTAIYLGVVLPYLTTLISLVLADLKDMPRFSRPRNANCFYVLTTLLVSMLLYWNATVWRSYYNKYRDCDHDHTIAQLRAIIPSDCTTVMGRYSFWIGLSDYEYYRYAFRTFEDIASVRPEIFIYNDLGMSQRRSAELKAQLDDYFKEHAEEIGRVKGHPKDYCGCGQLRIYRVEWE